MNKLLTLSTLIALSLSINQTHAQETKQAKHTRASVYFRLGAGYALPSTSQTRDVDGLPLNGSSTYISGSGYTSMQAKKASFSSGVQSNLSIGVMINEHFGVELNTMIGLNMNKYESHNEYYSSGNDIVQNITQYAKSPIIVIPSLVAQTGKKVNVYLRTGIALPAKARMYSDFTIAHIQQGYTERGELLIKSKMNCGFNAAIGIKAPIADHVLFWAEASFLSLSLYVRQTEFLEYSQNGISYVNRLQNKITYYGNNISTNSEVTYSYPFSNAGGNIGLSIEL